MRSTWIIGEIDDSGRVLDTPLSIGYDPRIWFGPFKDGAEIARFVFEEADPKMGVDFKPAFSIAFSDPVASEVAAGDPVIFTLDHAMTHIRTNVVPRFLGFF